MLILALDPGPVETGWVVFDTGLCRPVESGVTSNVDMLAQMARLKYIGNPSGGRLAIEMIASYGMAVGKDVFETCVWIGRFMQAWHTPEDVQLVYRRDVKMHLCNSPKAKDANVRQALIDLIGPQGTKKAPGPTYGVKSHAWAALGVAVTAARRGV